MRFLLALSLCALAVLAVGATKPQVVSRDDEVVHVSMKMPSLEERRQGMKTRGSIPRRRGGPTPRLVPPKHLGPPQPQPDIAGRLSNKTAPFIHNGETASAGQFPWMLSVLMDSSYFCGGSIISEEWVLTAGHCVDGIRQFKITAGSLKSQNPTESSAQIVTSTEKYRHPDYNADFIDNDIGIVRVPTKFVFGDYVRPIRLPSYGMAMDMMVGKTATLSGWGLTSDSASSVSPTLNYVDMVIDDGSSCYNYYGNVWIPTKICFDTSKDKKSSCSGDSGGPLIIQEEDGAYTEIGLTSFGASAGCAIGMPIAFTRVASFLEFIETTTNLIARD